MSTLAPGSYVYLSYLDDDVWHERLILGWVTAAEYVVLAQRSHSKAPNTSEALPASHSTHDAARPTRSCTSSLLRVPCGHCTQSVLPSMSFV